MKVRGDGLHPIRRSAPPSRVQLGKGSRAASGGLRPLAGLKARKISLQEVDDGDRRGAGQTMALIKSFEHKSRDRYAIHDGIDATTTTFERDGRKFIQVDSYGRAER